MSRKPRLVHEGSPIRVDDGDDLRLEDTMAWNNDQHWNVAKHQPSHYSGSHKAPVPTKSKFLQTKLVIGGVPVAASNRRELDDEDSLDAMMTDNDDFDDIFNTHPAQQQQNNFMHSHSYPHTQNVSQPNEYQSFQQPQPQPTTHIHHMPPPSISPLVVIDGANISYAYAESLNPSPNVQPNPHGITIAIQYFLKNNCRVQAVVPTSWYKLKPRSGDYACSGGYKGNLNRRDDAKMVTEEVEELRMLRQNGFLVTCPPGDDDDAYAIALARREGQRLVNQQKNDNMQEDWMMLDDECDNSSSRSRLGGYVLSNDFFHDAIRRDQRQMKQHKHVEEKRHHSNISSLSIQQSSNKHSLKAWLKKHRISYSFANIGLTTQNGGNIELEFLPNPRHELIEAIDAHNALHQNNNY